MRRGEDKTHPLVTRWRGHHATLDPHLDAKRTIAAPISMPMSSRTLLRISHNDTTHLAGLQILWIADTAFVSAVLDVPRGPEDYHDRHDRPDDKRRLRRQTPKQKGEEEKNSENKHNEHGSLLILARVGRFHLPTSATSA
ncbi:hypothetical protein HY970_00790 [Candidatus Kaiserbacteria bacterium]|nr:hypothetical protein [Candidatus Kaiserbacteria bacterium]